MKKINPGFTLIELIVTVMMVAVLAAVAVPMVRNATEQSNGTRAITNLNMMATAARMYFSDTGDTTALVYPDIGTINARYGLTIQDPSFTYSGNQTGLNFAFQARRNAGSQAGSTITINQTGAVGGTWPWL